MNDIREYDTVALLVDMPDSGLHRGDEGTVVHMFGATDAHPAGFIVEFVDEADISDCTLVDISDPSLVELRFRHAGPVRTE
jgi:hypothetical protein